MPFSVMTILTFSRKEFSVISMRFRSWALPTNYSPAASVTRRISTLLTVRPHSTA